MNRFQALLLLLSLPAAAQPVITTVAGADWLFPGDGKPALNAPLSGLVGLGVGVDRQGNYYIADPGNNMVMRVGPDGIVNVIAGNGINLASGEGGLAVNASLLFPSSVAVDSAGTVYITEFGSRVRRVTPQGVISSLAGRVLDGFSGDNGPSTQALVNSPGGVAVDLAGNVYIADTFNNRVRKISTAGIITTVAGNGQMGLAPDNVPATSAPVEEPTRIAVDGNNNLYIVETNSFRIMKVTPNGIISTFAGGGMEVRDNAPATSNFVAAMAVATDDLGNVYVLERLRMGIVKITPEGILTTIAGGSGLKGYLGDGGPATRARFNFLGYPSVAVDSLGNIYVGDDGNERIRRINPQGVIQTVAGNGLYHFSGDGGPAVSATLDRPVHAIRGPTGDLFISEGAGNRIRRVAPDGTISVFAGTGAFGFSGDEGPAVNAQLGFPAYLQLDSVGNLIFTDSFNCAIRFIDPDGIIHTYAGGVCGNAGDGGEGLPARQASMGVPEGFSLDGLGNLIYADTQNHRVRFISPPPDSRVFTIAGDGLAGFSGDNGRSLEARVNTPRGVAVFGNGVFFADSENHRIRRIDFVDLKITTVAGNGVRGRSGDGGLATAASLNAPEGIAFDDLGNLYIADEGNSLIRKVTPAGIISTIAGYPPGDLSGRDEFAKQPFSSLLRDGHPATEGLIGFAKGISTDPAGNIFVADLVFDRVRAILANPPSFQVSPQELAFTAPAGGATQDQNVEVVGSISGTPITVTVSAPWLTATPQSTELPATLRIAVNPAALTPGDYQGTVTISAPTALPATRTVRVTLSVTAPGAPSLSVNPNSIRYSFVQQSPAQSKTLAVANSGGGTLPFRAITATTGGGAWLSASPANGTLGPFGSTSVSITATPGTLAPGTYSGTVTLENTNATQRVVIPVTMTVSAVLQTIRIPESGLTFYAVENGVAPPPQSFNILNVGRGQMTFSTSATTRSGGSWLSAQPSTGVSDADSPQVPQIRVFVNPENLRAGVYYGTVQVTAPSADNSPQFVSVVLNVLQPGSRLGPIVQPTGLIFTAVEGAEPPGSQTITLQSTDAQPVPFRSGRVTADGRDWFTSLPGDGTLTPTQPARIVVQPITQGLSAGIYRGTLTLTFSGGATRVIALVLVIVPSGVNGARGAGACLPKKLAPVFTFLSTGFALPAGFPGQVGVKVVDDCGNLMTTGDVIVKFSNGDPPLRLVSLKDGNWAATWVPQRLATPVTITAEAAIPAQNISGTEQITGGLSANDAIPVIGAGAILNGASYALQRPLAPGSFVSLFGTRLAQGPILAPAVPLPVILGGSTIVLAGREVPVYYASGGQINAIVPYGIKQNTDQQVLVSAGNQLSTPQSVTIAPAAPGIFTIDGSGTGQGIITVAQGGQQPIADAANPARAGDVLVIYCTGLGEVDPPLAAGTATPTTFLTRTVNPVAATIGGVAADVSFSGLTPGSTGLYQVNVTVPAGVAAGDRVDVVISAAGQQSNAVTIAVQ